MLAAVRATRAARSLVQDTRTDAYPPPRLHRFCRFLGDVEQHRDQPTRVLQVVAATGELVPARSIFEFIRQAATEQVEVCREISRRGLAMPREIPIDEPFASAIDFHFAGIEKGLKNWEDYDISVAGYSFGERQPRGSILSFLVDRDALAVLARAQRTADVVARSADAWADPVMANVLPFVEASPWTGDVAAFLGAVCSTACGGAGTDGLWLEVSEAADYRGASLLERGHFLDTRRLILARRWYSTDAFILVCRRRLSGARRRFRLRVRRSPAGAC